MLSQRYKIELIFYFAPIDWVETAPAGPECGPMAIWQRHHKPTPDGIPSQDISFYEYGARHKKINLNFTACRPKLSMSVEKQALSRQ